MLDRSLVYDFWGHEVKLIDQFPIYELGGALRHLREIGGRETEDPFEQGYALWVAAQQLAKVIDGEQPLNFCRGAAVDLLAELRRAEQALSKPSDETVKPMAPWQFHGIRNKIDVFSAPIER